LKAEDISRNKSIRRRRRWWRSQNG